MSRWWTVRRSIKVAAVTIILLVVSLLTILTIMPRPRHGRQRVYNFDMRTELVDLAVAESLYFSEHDVYTTDLDTLARLLPYPLSRMRIMMIEIDRADAGGWHATITHPGITQTCTLGADGPPVPRPEPADLHQFCSEDWEYRTRGPEALVLSGVHLDIERENGTARYVGETMLITSVPESASTVLNYDRTFTNHVIQVETTLVGGTDNNWQTVMCRWTSADNYYELGIGADGYFLLDVWVDGRRLNKSLGPTRSHHIRLGRNVVNVLRAECVGNTLRLSVNGHVLAEINDDNHASGAIGVSVVSLGYGYSAVSFDNLVVTTR